MQKWTFKERFKKNLAECIVLALIVSEHEQRAACHLAEAESERTWAIGRGNSLIWAESPVR